MQFFTATGVPLAGGLLYTYAASTTLAAVTYTDSTGTATNTNPVVLNARGEASVWLGTDALKFVLKDSTGALIWTADNISGVVTQATLTAYEATLAGTGGAALIGYDYLNAAAANTVAAELRQAQAQTQHFWAKARANQTNVYFFVTGDSTGNDTTEWVYLTAQWLATKLATHTIKYRVYDASTGWSAYSTVQVGSGAYTVFIDNASVSGTNTFYTDGGRQSAIWTGINYDLVIINYGHNIGTNATESEALPEWVIAASHCRLMAPLAGLLITLQNPRTSVAGANQSARLTSAWRKTADLVGAGVIDVYTAFKTYPNPAALYVDETHPNSLGSQVWSQEVQRVMAEPPRYTNFGPQGVNPLSQTPTNYIYNPRFVTWGTGSNPAGWTFTNCTPTKNVSVTDGSLYSAQITIGAGTNPVITADVSSALPH